MRKVVQTSTGTTTGALAPVPMDQYISPFNVAFAVVPSVSATYTVQHTFDDVFAADYNPSTGTWFNHEVIASETGNNDGNYAFPVTAIRLNIAASGGPVTFTIAQAGIGS